MTLSGAELAMLKSPMANLNPIWFTRPDGV
jgi:hypothetical protein